MTLADRWISAADVALRTASGAVSAGRPMPRPAAGSADTVLDEEQRRLAGALMRVNHVGEVCAQALYQAQLLGATEPALRAQLADACREENDHLAWTRQRLSELGAQPSRLNPLWFAGAFAIGLVAGRHGDRVSLGFVVETERQVEQHLAGHLDRLPAADHASRAIVEVMKTDEAGHAERASHAGAAPLPAPARWLMRAAARVMTATAHRI